MLGCALLTLGGCAIGQTIDYRKASPELTVRTTAPVQLQVIDQRPYVLALEKQPTFVGRLRGLYYNPWNVNTESGMPLAADIEQALRVALTKASVKVAASDGANAASHGQRLLVVTLREWKMDAYMNARFDFDVTVSVIDEQGTVLAACNVKNSSPVNNFVGAGAEVLRAVLDAPSITHALSSAATPSASISLPAGPTPIAQSVK